MFTATVVASSGVAFGVFIRQHRTLGLHNRHRCVVFRGDHFQAALLALEFLIEKTGNFWIELSKILSQ